MKGNNNLEEMRGRWRPSNDFAVRHVPGITKLPFVLFQLEIMWNMQELIPGNRHELHIRYKLQEDRHERTLTP
jgi:hypothetical protein